jgi:nucleotide-binding universal stress UspA family protein
MTHRQPRILVGCDGSTESHAALAWATQYAKETGGVLTLVNAWQWPTVQGAPVILERERDPREMGLHLLERLKSTVDLPEDRLILDVSHGAPAHVLLQLAADADLLVVGSHGLGAFSRLVLGSVSARCATHASCPVVVVRPGAQPPVRKVVVGVDDSPVARMALRWAMDYADLMHWPLSVVHAVDIPVPPIPFGYPVTYEVPRAQVHRHARKWLRETVAKVEADRGCPLRRPASFHVVEGNPGHALVHESDEASIVVVGRRGAGGFARLLVGSTAAALAHHATSTCVVIPPPVT